MVKYISVMVAFLVAMSLDLAVATSAEISRTVPGSFTINIICHSADIDCNGVVDHRDLLAVANMLNVRPAAGARVDINRDGVVDILDLAIVAQLLERLTP